MDEARLRQELLRGRFIVGHAVRREVIVDLDAPTFLVPTARVDGQALEIEEDLHLVLGDFDPQLFVTVDMRGAVVVALDADVTVGVQLRFLPFPAVELALRQRFQRGPLERLEAIAARYAKARMAALIDALDTLIERLVDLRE